MDRLKPLTTFACLTMCGVVHADPDTDIFDDFIIRPNETVSFDLKVADANLNRSDAFSGGPATLPVGTLSSPVSVGLSTAGNYDINVGWDEFFDNASPGQGVASRIRFDIATSNGSPFISSSDFDNGFRFLQWEIGDHLDQADQPFADPIAFKPTVENVFLVEATVVFFQGDTVQNSIDYGFTLDADWDGTDAVVGNIFSVDATTNRIEITYDYTPIPAPATAATLVATGLVMTRRRRA